MPDAERGTEVGVLAEGEAEIPGRIIHDTAHEIFVVRPNLLSDVKGRLSIIDEQIASITRQRDDAQAALDAVQARLDERLVIKDGYETLIPQELK